MPFKRNLRALLAAVALCLSTLMPHVPAYAQASAPAPAASAPATPAPPAVAAEPTVTKETIDNPYGLEALWKQGDFVARGTLIIMVIMSMGSWYIIFTKVFEQRKLLKSARAAGENFWKSGSVKKGVDTLDEGSAFRFIAEEGIKADEHHEGSLVEQIDRHTWITMSVQRAVDNIQSRLQDGLAFLATVGSTAPFVGLFGTVWGIYHALTAIGIAGQASIDKVAGPVGEALIMTAFGLAVAVPAVMGYNWLIRRNKTVMERVRAFSGDLHNVLLAGKR
ncbi:MAG TPA: MotA/TolQ/ExbB proton channel family protein [Burkholderiaceae bacterium]|nr:MotA/TolQ/ExbB proton channel family protein [Burkholderiaceae bacterium]